MITGTRFIMILILTICFTKTVSAQLWSWTNTFNYAPNYYYQQICKHNSNFIIRAQTSQGSDIVCVDSSGNLLWKKSFANISLYEIKLEGDTIWTVGNINSLVQLNSQSYSSGSFIMRLDINAEIVSFRVFNSTPVSIRSLEIKGNKIYVTGGFTRTLTLDSIVMQGDSLQSSLFVAKLRKSDFHTESAVSSIGGVCSGTCIRIDKNDNVLLMAYASYYIQLNGIYLTHPNNSGVEDGLLLVKLNNSFQVQWTTILRRGQRTQTFSSLILLDSLGNCTVNAKNDGGSGAMGIQYVQKYSNSTGNLLWKKGFGTCSGNIDQDEKGNIYTVGTMCSYLPPYIFTAGKISPAGQIVWQLTDTLRIPVNLIKVVQEDKFYTVDFCNSTVANCAIGKSLMAYYSFPSIVSIEDNSFNSDQALTIFPNPTSGIFSLVYKSGKSSRLIINVTSLFGQTILSKEYPEQYILKDTLDLTGLTKGIYFIMSNTDHSAEAKKVIID